MFKHCPKWLPLAILCLLPAPASAELVTDTFTGTVAVSDSLGAGFVTTNDINGYFGGGNLIGNAFTLTTTLNTSTVPPGPSTFFVGSATFGSFYQPPNPMTAALTINGQTFSINESSDGFTSAGTPGQFNQQAFIYNSGHQLITQQVYLDLFSNSVPGDFTKLLPAMISSDFTAAAAFLDGFGETLALNIDSVNVTATPLPAAWLMFLPTLCAAGFAVFRRKKTGTVPAATS
jgi:hypothetical protein